MVTGDHVDVAETIGAAVGVDEVLAECSPEDKVAGSERVARSRTVRDGRRRHKRCASFGCS